MKKSRIIIGTSAFFLAIAGFYATKANHRVVTPSSAVVYNGSVAIADMSSFTSGFNTVATGKKLVQLVKTNGSSASTILGTVQTSSGTGKHKVYR